MIPDPNRTASSYHVERIRGGDREHKIHRRASFELREEKDATPEFVVSSESRTKREPLVRTVMPAAPPIPSVPEASESESTHRKGLLSRLLSRWLGRTGSSTTGSDLGSKHTSSQEARRRRGEHRQRGTRRRSSPGPQEGGMRPKRVESDIHGMELSSRTRAGQRAAPTAAPSPDRNPSSGRPRRGRRGGRSRQRSGTTEGAPVVTGRSDNTAGNHASTASPAAPTTGEANRTTRALSRAGISPSPSSASAKATEPRPAAAPRASGNNREKHGSPSGESAA